MADSDDLSRTATEHARGKPTDEASAETLPASSEDTSERAKELPAAIGKYRIERELGAGGMGVVYVAFDPDLERRVALKVLRARSGEAAQRLQREARAMARLKHRNVVTVHEVATAAGRDYVAMELVEGESLAEWLRATKRPQAEIIDAFVQAGRGLAAAHAAGIVHRDFKPHNVLRDRAGHVSVTDFGLAREASIEVSGDPMAVTMPVGDDTASKSSSLAGLTVTGALLGTPAYMAPEQWTGGAVTPATDQFAYCVALWEAVTGARPFTGATVEMLRAQILEGSAELDASALPKQLRAPLLRGLDADPKKRWPSMDALLAAIAPPVKSSRLIIIAAIGAAAAVAITGAVLSMRGEAHEQAAVPAVACSLPALSPGEVWFAKKQTLVDHGRSLAVSQIDADVKAWMAAREKACAMEFNARLPVLTCLDAVMGRVDAAVQAISLSTADRQLDAGAVLVDPAVCMQPHTPHLLMPSPEMRIALAMEIEQSSGVKETFKLAAKIAELHDVGLPNRISPQDDPCAAMYVHEQRASDMDESAKRAPEIELMEQGLERCTDERARADGAFASLALELRSDYASAAIEKRLRQAEIAAEPVMQADLRGQLEDMRAHVAMRMDDRAHALPMIDASLADYAARQRIYREIGIANFGVAMHQLGTDDSALDEIHRRLTTLRARANDVLGPASEEVHQIDSTIAYWSFAEGDAVGSHAKLAALQKPGEIEHPVPASGKVVDEQGHPVAGATVAAGKEFIGDEVSIALAVPGSPIRTTTTAADGTFSLPAVIDEGVVVAQLDDRRSAAVAVGEKLVLTLHPTSRIEGTVDLQGLPAHRVIVMFFPLGSSQQYATTAPVQRDGTFHIAGVLHGKQRVTVAVMTILGQSVTQSTLDVKGPSMTGIKLAAPSDRTLYVVLRSTVAQPLINGEVFVINGTLTATNLAAVKDNAGVTGARIAVPARGATVPDEVRSVARDGDLYVAISGVAPDATACAAPLPANLTDPTLNDRVKSNAAKIPMVCKPIPAGAKVLVEDVPPWPRLD